jgi:hypothetical protein
MTRNLCPFLIRTNGVTSLEEIPSRKAGSSSSSPLLLHPPQSLSSCILPSSQSSLASLFVSLPYLIHSSSFDQHD